MWFAAKFKVQRFQVPSVNQICADSCLKLNPMFEP